MYIHICTYPCLGKWLHAKIDAPIQECAYTSHHTSYQNVGVYVLSYIYIYCEQIDPCSGCALLLQFGVSYVSVSSVSTWHCGAEPDLFLLVGVLSQQGVGMQVLEMIRGLSYAIAPLSPHSHPPCSVLLDSTEHEGWELIELTLMYTRQA